MTTQTIKKQIDLTGLMVVTASEINQLTDTAIPADDKGIIIVSDDSALDIPVVPNPNTAIIGITPTWWTRFIWLRRPFDNTGLVKLYIWNTFAVSDVIYLKWINLLEGVLNQTDLATLNDAIQVAGDTATTALSAAQNATLLATNAYGFAGDVEVALETFKAFFGPSGQVPWVNITGKPENVSGVKYLNAHRQALNVANAAAFADTGWLFLDLSAYVDLFANDIALAPQLCSVIISVKIETQLIGASAGLAQAAVYFSNASTVDPAYLTDSRFVFAKVVTTSPNNGSATGQKEFQVGLTGTKGIYYRWASTGLNNSLQVYVTGFINDVTKLA